MRLLDFATVTPREVAPGYLGRYLHSDQITQGRVDIAPGAVIPSRPLAECWKKRFVVSDESVSFLAIA